ncbi:tRNA lysidine(34) synthetase TilS [Candidatus Omnitrophota bacterium]
MIRNKILDTIRKFNLLSFADRVLIGVSGGPDSLALLYLLNDLSVKLGLKIIICHLNHGLRGRSADLDERFVKDIASDLELDFFSKKVSGKQLKSKNPNEETLRKLRYDFMFDLAKRCKVDKIALAHTLDDQAETVLMRIIRGTGLYGLISILPKRKIKSFVIIRPMIEVSREEIEDYLKEIKVKPRIDKTNFSNRFLRNRIRHGIMKDLGRINPSIRESLGRFAQQAAVDYDYLYQKSRQFLKPMDGPLIKVELEKFRNLHIALQRMVVRVALEKTSGGLRTFTNRHWEEIQNLIEIRPFGSIVHLSKKVCVRKDKRHITIRLIKTKN